MLIESQAKLSKNFNETQLFKLQYDRGWVYQDLFENHLVLPHHFLHPTYHTPTSTYPVFVVRVITSLLKRKGLYVILDGD